MKRGRIYFIPESEFRQLTQHDQQVVNEALSRTSIFSSFEDLKAQAESKEAKRYIHKQEVALYHIEEGRGGMI